ncbi:MAG: fructose-6-phosphate aldolase [bacterium]|nr:fructose-6-phosphate aldolase [bacterium]MBK9302869.1 fructose-6-phosphate aldolase [bacterium]
MKFFIDTADLDEIRDALSMGVLDGVTTNPSLMARAGRKDTDKLLKEICDLVEGPVSGEVVALDAAGMIKEGKRLSGISEHLVVKIPLTIDGLKATRALSDEGIPVNMTLCFTVSQALLAAKAGAAYVSPFVGRLDDISQDGMGLIEDIVTVFEKYEIGTEIIVASVRHPDHVVRAALLGADIATIPHKVIKQLVQHPLTDQGIAAFMKDWNKLQG